FCREGVYSDCLTRRLAAALFLFVHFAQAAFDARTLDRVPLAVEPVAQFGRLVTDPLAAFAAARAIAFAAAPARRLGMPATVIAGQRAVRIADVADAAAHVVERAAGFAPIGSPASGHQRIATHPDIGAGAQIRSLRDALSMGRRHRQGRED